MKRRGRRNWVDLPRDTQMIIFSKLAIADILLHAQFVCSSWLQLAQDRCLFRSISLRNIPPNISAGRALKLFKEAVDRSRGGLLDVSLRQNCFDVCLRPLPYLVHKSKLLRSLRISIPVTIRELLEAFRNFPLLEEFELSNYCVRAAEVIKELGHSCSRLKHFGLRFFPRPPHVQYCEDIQLSVAENIPGLQTILFSRMCITERGLQSILHQCALIKNLNFCECYSYDMTEELQKTCLDRFRDFQVPSKRTANLAGRSRVLLHMGNHTEDTCLGYACANRCDLPGCTVSDRRFEDRRFGRSTPYLPVLTYFERVGREKQEPL